MLQNKFNSTSDELGFETEDQYDKLLFTEVGFFMTSYMVFEVGFTDALRGWMQCISHLFHCSCI
jgi:hypothetical protein